MIHDLSRLGSLPSLGPLEVGRPSLGLRLASYAFMGCGWLLVVPLALLAMLWALVLSLIDLLTPGPDASDDMDSEDLDNDDPDDELAVDASYDDASGWLQITMSRQAFAAFLDSLEQIYPARAQAGGAPTLVDARGTVDTKSPGYHAHSDMFFPALPIEITVGTGEGCFHVIGGMEVYASTQTWRRAIRRWRELTKADERRLIVLDRDQTDWCNPECTGRISVAYIPDFVPDSEKLPREPPV